MGFDEPLGRILASISTAFRLDKQTDKQTDPQDKTRNNEDNTDGQDATTRKDKGKTRQGGDNTKESPQQEGG